MRPTQSAAYYQAHPEQMALAPNASAAASLTVLTHMAKSHTTWLPTMHCVEGRPGHPLRRRTADAAAQTTTNWSGYESRKGGYLMAAMEWTVHPAVAAAGTSTTSSIWPGIGTGTSTADSLIQAGTRADADCTVSCSTTYYPWIEIYPQESEEQISNLPIKPGDLIGVLVEYDPVSAEAYFELDDETTQVGVSGTEDVTGSVVGSGSQAEWIVERPYFCFITCDYSKLTNFGTEPIVDAQAITGDTWDDPDDAVVNAGTVAQYEDSMYSCTNTLMAQPSAITSGTNFNVTWKSYGNWENC